MLGNFVELACEQRHQRHFHRVHGVLGQGQIDLGDVDHDRR